MKNFILSKLRKMIYVLGFGKVQVDVSATKLVHIEEYLSKEIRRRKNENPLDLCGFEYQVFSQNGEDGIIHEIFNRIGTTNQYFVEFGVGNGLENDSAYLLLQKWHGAWIEGNEQFTKEIEEKLCNPIQQGYLKVLNAFINQENILDHFKKLELPNEFDLLAIDLDGNDYWIWKELDKYSPRVVSIEFNGSLGPDVEWKMKYDPGHIWGGKTKGAYFGASLKALELLGKELGYCLVGTNLTGVNAFFVREDLVTEHLFLGPFTSKKHFNKPLYFMEHNIGHMRNHEVINSVFE